VSGVKGLRIWGRANSSNVQKVLWVADELGLHYERIEAGGKFGVTNDPSYRAMNPNGLVPTIEDDGFVLWESNVVVRYLAMRERATALLPATDAPASLRERAEVEKWMDWSSTALAPAMHGAFWGLVRTPPEERDAAAITASAAKTEQQFRILEERLAGRPWLAGDRFTVADIPAGIFAWRWYGLPWADAGYTRPSLPQLDGWYARLTERPAYRRWVMQPIT
jgi:glutathione S-transferase